MTRERSNGGDYYLDRMFSTDLTFATSLILKNVRMAKENEQEKHCEWQVSVDS